MRTISVAIAMATCFSAQARADDASHWRGPNAFDVTLHVASEALILTMPKRKGAEKEIPSRAWARTAGGHVKWQFTISAEQDKALREEAFKRAMASGSRKPDASEVLREVLDEWLKKRGK